MTEKKDFKKVYSDLAKKHSLPDYNLMDNDFEINDIDSEFALREIRRKMHDRIDALCKMLDGILQPEATLNNMYESGAFSDEEKKSIYYLYKELMVLNRASLVLEMKGSDELDAKFIIDVSAKWKKIKSQAADIFKKLEDSWKKDSDIEEKLGYFG